MCVRVSAWGRGGQGERERGGQGERERGKREREGVSGRDILTLTDEQIKGHCWRERMGRKEEGRDRDREKVTERA